MTVSWFDGVTLTVEIAFTTDPLDAVPSWTDVSADVRGLSTSSGRSSEFSSFSPSTLSITLSNRTRQYDPEYASSPYVGNLLPMKRIRVRATYSATTYDLFTGYIQGWPQQYEFHFDSTVTVQAVDGSRFLEQAVLPGSAYEREVLIDAPIHYWPMQEQNTAASSQYVDVVAGHDLELQYAATNATVNAPLGSASMPTLQSAGDPNMAAISSPYIDAAPRALEAWIDFSLLSTWTGGPFITATFDVDPLTRINIGCATEDIDDETFSIRYYDGTNNDVEFATTTGVPLPTGGIHHVALAADASNIYLYLDGVQVHTKALVAGAFAIDPEPGLEVYVSPSAGISHVAVYDTAPAASRWLDHYLAGVAAYGHPYGERSGARIDRILDDAGWPAADRDLSTGDTVHGRYLPAGGSAMSALRDVETAEDGYVFIDSSGNVVLRDRNWQWTQTATTFSDDGSDTSYDSITIDANSVDPLRSKVSATYRNGDGYLFTEDAASLAAYGPATEALSVPTIDSAVTARGLTEYKLRTMKDPRTRITQINVKPRAKPATAFPAVLNLELGDRANVEITPMNLGSQVVKAVTVQGIAHNITVDGTWDTTLYCSPAPELATAVPYLTLGHATYGRIGAAAGNTIPF